MNRIQMQMIDNTVPSDWWKALIRHFVSVGDAFEIRCWKEEPDEVRQAAMYGSALEDGLEVSVRGTVSPGLLAELLSEEPADREIYNKMTKYFTLNVKSGPRSFIGAHYGTEIYIDGASDDDMAFFKNTIERYDGCFSIDWEEYVQAQ